MKKFINSRIRLGCWLLVGLHIGFAQNPLILDQFTADPSARVFNDMVYVYPSHDINCGTNWFCMQDYHVFSSADLIDWTDHGVILTQEEVAWVDASRNSMWAPDCCEKDGSYYFYFPAIADRNTGIRGMAIGVAIGAAPNGPFTPQPEPIKGVSGIDPNVFIDQAGQAYLYWASRRGLYGAKLQENMRELAGASQSIKSLPKGMKEGPFVFERNGLYYFTFPHVIDTTEALVYCMGNHPLGPFEYKGVFMDEFPSCWTNHHSVIEYKGQWYLFYHHNDLSPDFDKNRSIRADSLFFNEDGSIQKVIPSLRGVGLTDATRKIQIDRYSAISEKGVSVDFLDADQKKQGWKVSLKGAQSWIRYNSVDFSEYPLKTVCIKATSKTGGMIEIHIDGTQGPPIANVEIPKTHGWMELSSTLLAIPAGVHNLVIAPGNEGNIEIDWISFQ
jgi:hypothetical protein